MEVRVETKGRDTEAETGAEAMEEAAYWLGPFSLLLHISQDHL